MKFADKLVQLQAMTLDELEAYYDDDDRWDEDFGVPDDEHLLEMASTLLDVATYGDRTNASAQLTFLVALNKLKMQPCPFYKEELKTLLRSDPYIHACLQRAALIVQSGHYGKMADLMDIREVLAELAEPGHTQSN